MLLLAGGTVAENLYLQSLVNTEQPARMVGMLTPRQMRPHELERLVGVCLTGASLMWVHFNFVRKGVSLLVKS